MIFPGRLSSKKQRTKLCLDKAGDVQRSKIKVEQILTKPKSIILSTISFIVVVANKERVVVIDDVKWSCPW